MLLAGDVGGTKTLLGLYRAMAPRPERVAVRSYPTSQFGSFTEILDAFAADLGQAVVVEAAVVGVAGPVVDDRATLTNVGWAISAGEIATRVGAAPVRLLNDLEAMSWSVTTLEDSEIEVLQRGAMAVDGNAAVIAAGTGLGTAFLHRVNGQLRAAPSEGGHADFAARSDRDMELVRMLRTERGRAEIEQVVSGQGLLNLHRLTHPDGPCLVVVDRAVADAPAQVSQAGLDGTCQRCVDALGMFVEAYGAEAGNVALRGMATAGVYVGGGIAAKILPALRDGRFMRAFRDKAPMAHLVAAIPVFVIVNNEAGLLGAAVAANALLQD